MENNNIDYVKEPTYVSIEKSKSGRENTVDIRYAYHILSNQKPNDNGNYEFYIPAFDIYFFGKKAEDAQILGRALMKSFMNFWANKNGIEKLAIQLHQLGFRSPQHQAVLLKLTKTKKLDRKTRFAAIVSGRPQRFEKASVSVQSGELNAA